MYMSKFSSLLEIITLFIRHQTRIIPVLKKKDNKLFRRITESRYFSVDYSVWEQ